MICCLNTYTSGQLFLDQIIVDFLRCMMSKHCNVDSMLISNYFRIRAAMLNDAGIKCSFLINLFFKNLS